MTKFGTALARSLRTANGLFATLVGLALLLTGIVGGAASVAGHEFSSQPTVATYAYDGPAPVAHGVSTTVRSAAVLTGSAHEGSPTVEGSSARARGSGVAAETADHIVLGKSIGLSEQAAKIGGRDLMSDPAWQDSVLKAIANPETKISVALDGVEGSSTYARVANAALRGSQGTGTPFDWEMAQLMQSGRLPTVNFFDGGASVANPFG